MQRRHALFLALAATLVALPASSQQGKSPPTNLYIDVLTHNMSGMPDMGGMMGGLGGFMARRMDGEAGKPTYPTTRAGGMSGQYLDMPHNALSQASGAGTDPRAEWAFAADAPRSAQGRHGRDPPGKVPDVQ